MLTLRGGNDTTFDLGEGLIIRIVTIVDGIVTLNVDGKSPQIVALNRLQSFLDNGLPVSPYRPATN